MDKFQFPSSHCNSGSFSFNVTQGGNAVIGEYQWYVFEPGGYVPITGATSYSYTTPTINETKFYYVEVTLFPDCQTQTFDFTALVQSPPSVPVPVNAHVCDAGQATVSVQYVSGYSYTWYESATGLPLEEFVVGTLSTGQTYSLGGIGSSVLYITYTDMPLEFWVVGENPQACGPTGTAIVEINVTPSPQFISAPDKLICGSGTTTLSASGPGLVAFEWFTSSNTSGTPWKTGAQVESESLSSSKQYWVKGLDENGCSIVTSTNVTVSTLPAAPVVSNLELCAWEPISVATQGGELINWYFNNAIIQQSITLELPALMSTGQFTYEAETVKADGCLSAVRTPFVITSLDDCDEKLNWIQTTLYDQNGQTVGSTCKYFDDTGNHLQTQSKNITENKIFASEDLRDRFRRVVGSTLSAPITTTEFKYDFRFNLSTAGRPYDYRDFDFDDGSISNVLNPAPVDNSMQGSLGWYYSDNNTLEEFVPTTGFPYSRTEFYEDGSGEVKRSASPGDMHRLGMDHEVLSGTFPVYQELDDYITKRGTVLGLTGLPSTLTNEAVQSVVRDENGKFAISIADKSGKAVMSARSGTSGDNVLVLTSSITSSADPNSIDYRPLTYFYLLSDQAITITGSTDYVIEDLVSGETFVPSGTWPIGFYRIILNSGSISFSYANYFLDVSYQFYDDAGRLRYSVSPNGFVQWKNSSPFSVIDKTEYVYNHQGWLLSMTEPDAGTTHYAYRRDGKIRFSQNAQQTIDGTFSYTNYDYLGRPVESGQFTLETGEFFTDLKTTTRLEALEATWMTWSGTKKDWVKSHYDIADPDFDAETSIGSYYAQDFVRGAVSFTENENNKTWYSYDEFGRVAWMAQKPQGLSDAGTRRIFVTAYEYDFLGNVLEASSGLIVNGQEQASARMTHLYEYDADKRLSKVSTSVSGSDPKLRASYEYYLHGPLKRIELGEKLQGIDFVYNINGWLTQINHPDTDKDPGGDGQNDVHKDVFGMLLNYYESEFSNVLTGGTGWIPQPPIDGFVHGVGSLAPTPAFQGNRSLDFSSYSASKMDWNNVIARLPQKEERSLKIDPGTAWQPNVSVSQDQSIKKVYEFNKTADKILYFTYNATTGELTANDGSGNPRYYEPNQLYVNKTIDEDSNEVIEFTNKQGRTVLKKVQYKEENGSKHYTETYYVYDDSGNPLVVPQQSVKLVSINQD